jgi:Methyltransferase domain
MAEFRKFEHRAPSIQNAVDVFEGKWACNFDGLLPGIVAGSGPLFTSDPRPGFAAKSLGVDGRLDGMSVLELGPLEGAHTYQLEKLGAAEVLAIESNAEAYLKCLIVKELLNLKIARFMIGDFTKYLDEVDRKFDLVVASGVLYHMADPIGLIERISKVTGKCFVWTHYYDEAHYAGPTRERIVSETYAGVEMFSLRYADPDYGKFWGGNEPTAVWLKRDDILGLFAQMGLAKLTVFEDNPHHPNGACITFAVSRD